MASAAGGEGGDAQKELINGKRQRPKTDRARVWRGGEDWPFNCSI